MCGVSNYVAKLRADVLSAENLERIGHIFDFATLPFRLQGQHFRQGLPVHRESSAAFGLPPSFGLSASTVELPVLCRGNVARLEHRCSSS